ncbi:MAG TPA: hypothetical protein VF679_01045 [Pedobacter sp.]|jgi:hypothetical protein
MTILGEQIKIGSKIYFEGEKYGYRVEAFSENFILCWKPFNARQTYLYSIIDLERDVRGPDNLIFGSFEPYNTQEGAAANLAALERGFKSRQQGIDDQTSPADDENNWTIEVSYRRNAPLKITKVKP